MAFMCSGKKCSSVYSLFVFLAMVTVLWFVWFGPDALLGRNKTDNNLDKLSAQLTAIGNDYGRNVKITHGNIEAEYWAVNRQSVVRDVRIEITTEKENDKRNVTLALGDIVTYSDPYNPQKLVIEISNSVNIFYGGKFINSVILSEPLVYSYIQSRNDISQPFQHNIVLPKAISLSSENTDPMAQEQEDIATDGGYNVEEVSLYFDANPSIELVATANELHKISYIFSGLTAIKNGEKVVSIGTLKSQYNEEEGDDEGKRIGKYNFVADEVVMYKEKASTKPYSLNINTSLVFDSVRGEQNGAAGISSADILKSNFYHGPTHNRDVTLNNVTISNPEFIIRATGNFANIVGDPLPSGEVKINIDHIHAFLASELVAMQGKDLIEGAITKIIGQPLEGQDEISITLKRQKSGVFYIGQTTFEELVASVLSDSMIRRPSSEGSRLPETQLPSRVPVTSDEGEYNNNGAEKDVPASVPNP